MNKPAFDMFMHAADDAMLEEAQQPFEAHEAHTPRIRVLRCVAAVLACVILTGAALWRPWEPKDDGSAAQLLRQGYAMAVPEDAEEVSYSEVDLGSGSDVPMAQAEFTRNGVQYTCRALKTSQPEDISGLTEDWSESLDWKVGGLDMQLRQSDSGAYVGWYSPNTGTQWCLSSDGETAELMDTARSVAEMMGFTLATAPEGAENVDYHVFRLNDLVVGETTFTLDGVNYSYRIASTNALDEDFEDISGTGEDYGNAARARIGWCSARLYYDDGGAGKLVWFDVVPGLLYSLSMESGASEQAVMDMAGELYVPAQDDVG